MITEATFAAVSGFMFAAWQKINAYTVTKNPPNPLTVEGTFNIFWLWPHWEAARKIIDGQVTSAWRSDALNAKIGGVANSDHTKGLAVDIKPGAPWTLYGAAQEIRDAISKGKLGNVRQCIIEYDQGIIHLGYYPSNVRKAETEFLSRTDRNTYKTWTA